MSFPQDKNSYRPPALPPKPSIQVTQTCTHSPTIRSSSSISAEYPPPPPPLPPHPTSSEDGTRQDSLRLEQQQYETHAQHYSGQQAQQHPYQQDYIPDPGDNWLPEILKDKSTQDLAAILSSPSLLNAITHSPSSIHESLKASHDDLLSALSANTDLAARLADQEIRLAHQRSATQAQLLSTHTLERQWRQKQIDMDHALARFSPAALYQQLAQGVQEQAQVCQAMEESFLEADGEPAASEKQVADWVRKYREARVLFYLRQERKERWDEGRVGGWR